MGGMMSRWLIHLAHRDPSRLGVVELLTLILGGHQDSTSSMRLAATLLNHFGGLDALAQAHPTQLCEVPGIGQTRALRLFAALRLSRQLGSLHSATNTPVRCADDALAILQPRLRALDSEELHGLYLNRALRPITVLPLTRGSDRYTVVDSRQIFRPAVHLSASAVILAHNHPSGQARPSLQDVQVTQQVAQAGQLLGIVLLDHLIITQDAFCSMAASASWPPAHPLWRSHSPGRFSAS